MRFFFVGKTEEAVCTSCWTPFVGARARMMHQPQHKFMGGMHNNIIEKEHKQEFIKIFLAEIWDEG